MYDVVYLGDLGNWLRVNERIELIYRCDSLDVGTR
jgi:hypothetical protein